MFGLDEEAPKFDSGDLRQDLVDALTYQPAPERQEMKNRMMPHVMAYAARNREFGDQWRSRVIERPQTRLKNLIKRGIEQRATRQQNQSGNRLGAVARPHAVLAHLRRQEIDHSDAEGSGGRSGERVLEDVRTGTIRLDLEF